MTPAERLTARLDELASSLHRAGVTGSAGSRLLELAGLAAMKALELELRAEARNAPSLHRAARAELPREANGSSIRAAA